MWEQYRPENGDIDGNWVIAVATTFAGLGRSRVPEPDRDGG